MASNDFGSTRSQRSRPEQDESFLRRGGRHPAQQRHSLHHRLVHNASIKHPLYLWSAVGVILSVWFLTPVSDWVVSLVVSTVPIESDIQFGRSAWLDMKTKYPPVRDLWGVKRIGHELLQKAGVHEMDDSMEWSFAVVHAPMVNAFCFPGGVVRVTDSLLRLLKLTDGEIAALLGHEIGYVLHRHSQKRIVQQHLVKLVIDALNYDDQDDYDESFGQAVGELMLKNATYLGSLSFSRKDEYEADASSWELLVASGMYQPHALQSMLSKLWSYDSSSTGDTSWESTHPGTRDRIAALQVKWELLPTREQKRLVRYPVQ